MTSQAVMKRYLTSVAKNNEEYKDNKSMQTLASLIANYKNLDAEDKEVLNAKIESAYNKLQAKGVSASKSTSKATTTRRTKSSSDGGLKAILADLKKKLGAEKFRDATRGTDILKDIQIPALKKGKRIVRKKGKTTNQYGTFKNKVGRAYWESRANRYDANQPSQTRKYKLAKGGEMDWKAPKDLQNHNYKLWFVKGITKSGDAFSKSFVLHPKSNEDDAMSYIYEVMRDIKKITEIHFELKKFAKGGKTSEVNYNDILPILKEKLEDGVEILLPNEFEYSSEYKGEEVESKSRDGFIAFTDGGYEVTWFEFVSMFSGSGYNLPTKALDDELQRQVDYNRELAKERFMEEYPEIYEKLGFDVDYNSLYEAGYESEAEQLSEWENDYEGEGTIMCSVGAYYYSPENPRSKDGKHTIRVFGVVNLESPYHRRGNLEDSIDIDITFDSIEEMEEKLDYEISEICSGWFNGANYNESTEKLRVVRMAKGGKLSSKAKYIPKRDIAEIEVEKNGKSKSIDGANLLDEVYVNKGTKFAKGGEIEVGSIVNLPEIKMKDGRVQYERVVGGEVIGIEGGIYDVLNPKTNRLHRVTKEQIEQIDQEKAKHNRSRGSLRSNEDTYPKGTEFAKGGLIQHGLKTGDRIVSGKTIGTTIIVRNESWDEDAKVDLNTGKRTLITYDKKSKKWVEKMAQGGTTKRIKRMGC